MASLPLTMPQRRPQKSQRATPYKDTALASVQSPEQKPVKQQQPLLVLWNDLPQFLRDNEYIYSGYRPQSNSYRKCIESLRYVHNQTGNIYTQLVGVFMLTIYSLSLLGGAESRFPAGSHEDLMVLGVFIVGFITTLTLSFIFHTITNHSPEVQRFWLNLDFLGLLIAASSGFIPALWYTFYCMPKDTKILLIILNLSAQSIMAYVILFVPIFRTPPWRPVRAVVFSLTGSLTFVPIIAGFFVYDLEEMLLQGGKYYAIAAISYLSCALFYATRWPEKWGPGKFDIWGHSHQLFHVMGFLGALPHIYGLLQAFEHQKKAERC